MLSNAYFLAKFRFDPAENEPAKNLQNFVKQAPFGTASQSSAARARGLEVAVHCLGAQPQAVQA